MNIFSCFDGISCGQLALNKSSIKYNNYFASEIENKSIEITQFHYPNTIQLGDITRIDENCLNQLPKIDLLIGGSPCQSFSHSNTNVEKSGFNGKSNLFWEYSRILKWIKKYNNPQVKFLLENVKMKKKEWENIITNDLEINPIKIDSSLVSGQKRIRLYWTNINNITHPIDKNIYAIDLLENDAINLVSYSRKKLINKILNKALPLQSSSWRGINRNQYQNAVITTGKTNLKKYEIYQDNNKYLLRNLTPLESERLQTIPDNYTEISLNGKISNTNRYRSIGNAWTIDIISHIFNFI